MAVDVQFKSMGSEWSAPNDSLECRKDFPILSQKINNHPLVFLDNAASTQKPLSVIRKMQKTYEDGYANVHRGAYQLSAQITDEYERSRQKIADFIHAPGMQNVIFTKNGSESINLVAYSWGRHFLKSGDEIIITEMEHHSNLIPWQILAQEKDVVLRVIPVLDDGTLDLETYESLLSDKTKLVAVTHVSNVLGTVNPVAKIVQMAHDAGARVLVDGAQSTPHFPVDVQALDCDFFTFSGHKMLGPTGIGVLYGKEDILDEMPPFLGGGDMIADVWIDHATYSDLPFKFEAGTPPFVEAIGLGAAIDYLNAIGMDRVWQHEQEITQYALSKLKNLPRIRLFGPDTNRAGVVSFCLDDIHPHDVATVLDQYGVAIRTGHHCAQPLMRRFGIPGTARASFYIYNTLLEVDQLIHALHKTREFFG
ncbi:MAG: cysteine desulfurase [Calditrichaeota bacterium]|nr:cysteine desulfurase [Calditrichota bacterium]